MLEVNGGYLGKVPVLACVVGKNKKYLDRVSYATINLQQGVCYFPAYSPFLGKVVADLGVVFGKVQYTDKARHMIEMHQDFEKKAAAKYLDPAFQFKTKPYAHQVDAMLFALYNPRAALALDCGLGKTKIAIDYINYLQERALIVCPAALITNWEDEIKTHSSRTVNVVRLDDASAKKKKEKIEKTRVADIVLVSYETAARYAKEIWGAFDYDILLCDESHKLASVKSNRSKAIMELSQKAYRRIVMSGSMTLGLPEHLYVPLKVLAPQILNQPYFDFCRTYRTYATWNPNVPVGVKNLDQLNRKIQKHLFRVKKEDALDLPPQQIIDKHVDLSAEQRKLYMDILSDETLFYDEGRVDKVHKIAALNKLNQITNGFIYLSHKNPNLCNDIKCQNMSDCVEHKVKPYTKECAVEKSPPPTTVRRLKANPKLDLAMELVEDILADPDNRVLVWARYDAEIAMLQERLDDLGVKYAVIASDPAEDLREFRDTSKDIRVAIGNIAKGVGFTAVEASYSVYFNLSYALADWIQSKDRNYRIGQKKPVTIYRVLARNTVDDRVVEAINNKEDIFESLLARIDCLRCDRCGECFLTQTRPYEAGCKFIRKMTTAGKVKT